ncbi:hypothetical protein L873DRAFT_165507 [Choiromyces venosus 120613-1]|uniref:Transmembrane protein n=1 Tax=Choiromyces venosus 120613-1 TaxID=1336337 RepID=A0A3N4K2P5_9PEZI|nr:hypothetical protein L873DRAFT_165507 [Choiromyces venosus 120613-1]
MHFLQNLFFFLSLLLLNFFFLLILHHKTYHGGLIDVLATNIAGRVGWGWELPKEPAVDAHILFMNGSQVKAVESGLCVPGYISLGGMRNVWMLGKIVQRCYATYGDGGGPQVEGYEVAFWMFRRLLLLGFLLMFWVRSFDVFFLRGSGELFWGIVPLLAFGYVVGECALLLMPE